MSGPYEKTVVFCDFDGTITKQETFSTMLMELAPKKASNVLDQMYARKITLSEGVRSLLESLPSKAYGDIIEFSMGKEIRPGFVEFLDFLDERGVPFVLVSGGLHVMIQVILGPLTSRFAGVYALSLDLGGKFMRVVSDFKGEEELLAKVRVMDMYDCSHSVAIGDGMTDLKMGLAADTVFARGGLARYLNKKDRNFFAWEDFFDIRDRLALTWE